MNSEFFQKNKGLIIAGVIIIILIVISVSKNDSKTTTENSTTTQTEEQNIDSVDNSKENTSTNKPESIKTENTSTTGNLIREGVLLTSDDSKQGNYMVKTQNSVFYIRTSRDFNSLLNKEVKMVANGTVEKFSLVDIVVK